VESWRLVIVLGIGLFAVLQLFGPERENPPVDESRTVKGQTAIPEEVAEVIHRACKDCHSNETEWPWHSYIEPISWLVAHDVHRGRRNLNFSDWAQYDKRRAGVMLELICEEISDGEMPPKRYLLIHPKAKPTSSEVRSICEWTKAEQIRLEGGLEGG
jgi:hypothetical protein